ncbi:hypothetical protein STAFG_0015 [Streptomyces afghaniensis 772]|uniref:Uncharacterized protein n=1 Tax=Streptomyces afghaniensis 772 TaxID=1283301 RepID=S4NWE5_9ACTN|nr:hypothetical protein STAFG_0015 [Streptomyces afghaniensis 772]
MARRCAPAVRRQLRRPSTVVVHGVERYIAQFWPNA